MKCLRLDTPNTAEYNRGILRLEIIRFKKDKAEGNYGGAKRDRTADLLHAMQALSQLSYSPKSIDFVI